MDLNEPLLQRVTEALEESIRSNAMLRHERDEARDALSRVRLVIFDMEEQIAVDEAHGGPGNTCAAIAQRKSVEMLLIALMPGGNG